MATRQSGLERKIKKTALSYKVSRYKLRLLTPQSKQKLSECFQTSLIANQRHQLDKTSLFHPRADGEKLKRLEKRIFRSRSLPTHKLKLSTQTIHLIIIWCYANCYHDTT